MLMAIFDTMSEENIPAQIQWLYDCRSAETSLFQYLYYLHIVNYCLGPLYDKVGIDKGLEINRKDGTVKSLHIRHAHNQL